MFECDWVDFPEVLSDRGRAASFQAGLKAAVLLEDCMTEGRVIKCFRALM